MKVHNYSNSPFWRFLRTRFHIYPMDVKRWQGNIMRVFHALTFHIFFDMKAFDHMLREQLALSECQGGAEECQPTDDDVRFQEKLRSRFQQLARENANDPITREPDGPQKRLRR